MKASSTRWPRHQSPHTPSRPCRPTGAAGPAGPRSSPSASGGPARSRLGVDARDFGKRLEQLGLHARAVVFEVLLRPGGAGLHGPALHAAAARLGRFAGQPGDAVVRAERRVPLRAQVRQRRLDRLRERQHQRPARRHLRPDPSAAPGAGASCRLASRPAASALRHGEQHRIEAGENVHRVLRPAGLQLPAPGSSASRSMRVTRVLQFDAAGRPAGAAPSARQRIHGRHATQCDSRAGSAASATRPCASSTRTRVGAPGLAQSGRDRQRLLEALDRAP